MKGIYDSVSRRADNTQHSLIQEPEGNYQEQVDYLFISSEMRSSNETHYDYIVKLKESFKNVKSVELVSAVIPNKHSTDILNEGVLLLDVEELNFIKTPLNKDLKIFNSLVIKSPTKEVGGFVVCELGTLLNVKKCFTSPTFLNRLSIKIRKSTGELFDFGSSSSNNDKDYQNYFVFKIITEVKDISPIQYRNVY